MSEEVNNICLAFSCPLKGEILKGKNDTYQCQHCQHQVHDFTNASKATLDQAIKESSGKICGKFKRSQLSEQFLKYAAATLIASTALAISASAQEDHASDSLRLSGDLKEDTTHSEQLFGILVESQPFPIGGYEKFYATIASELKKPEYRELPPGKLYVQFIVDTVGNMTDMEVVKSHNEDASKKILQLLKTLNLPFEPGALRGKKTKVRMIIPVLIKTEN